MNRGNYQNNKMIPNKYENISGKRLEAGEIIVYSK
jgi:hypothetical protein